MPGFLVSVIIPAYNCERWIEQTINSVMNQTYSKIELILINDGSTDGTGKILKKYESQMNVKVYHIKNSGPAAARNHGVSKSKGHLIAFLDSDDYWHEKKIEYQVDFFHNNDCKLLLTNLKLVDKNNEVIGEVEKLIPIDRKEQTRHLFQGRITQNTPTIMVERQVFFEFNGFNTNLVHREDHFFLMEVANKYGISLLEQFLVYRRVWDNSMSSDFNRVEKEPNTIITYFEQTRLPFYGLALSSFSFIEKQYNQELARHYNKLSHILFMNNFIEHSRIQMKKAIKLNVKVKYILKLACYYLPSNVRNVLIEKYYNKSKV